MGFGFASLMVLSLGTVLGCPSSETLLAVDLKTDLAPGVEFTLARVALLDEDGDVAELHDTEAAVGGDFLSGRRLLEVEGLPAGNYQLTIELARDGDRRVAFRPLRIELSGRQAVTVVITRDCQNVMCPDGMDPEATACFSGRCVDPSCVEEAPDACGVAECGTAADCAPRATCAASACVAGACLYTDEGTCGAGSYCDPDAGCVPVPDTSAPPVPFSSTQISLSTGSGMTPDVTWDGTGWTVVWSEETETLTHELDVARVATDGTVVAGPVVLDTQPSTPTYRRPYRPSVAFNGTHYGVLWPNIGGPCTGACANVDFLLLDASFGVVDRFVVDDRFAAFPHLLWTGREFAAVVLVNPNDPPDSSATSHLYVQRITADGAADGSLLRITDDVSRVEFPAAAFNGRELGVAWKDGRDDGDSIRFVRASVDGTKLVDDVAVSAVGVMVGPPAIGWEDGAWRVVWTEFRAPEPARLLTRALDADGTPLEDEWALIDEPTSASFDPFLTSGSYRLVMGYSTMVDGASVRFTELAAGVPMLDPIVVGESTSGWVTVEHGAGCYATAHAETYTWPFEILVTTLCP